MRCGIVAAGYAGDALSPSEDASGPARGTARPFGAGRRGSADPAPGPGAGGPADPAPLVDSPGGGACNHLVPESRDQDATPPGPTPDDASPAPRIDRFSYYVLRRLNLGGLLLLATALCTADFLATGSIFWTGVLTGLEAVLAIPWAWTVVSMDRAESRILDSKRLGHFRRVAGHAVTFAALAVVLLAKAIVVQRAADVGFGATEGAYRTYVVFAIVLFAVGLVGRGTRLARFLGSVADHPARLMAISFAVVALFGGFLLTLPVSVHRWEDATFANGLFTSMSAVCVTGLTVNDIASTYTYFGQCVIFALFQAGGLGIMVLTAAVAIFSGRRLRTRSTAALTEMIDAESFAALRRTIRHIFIFTVAIEMAGAAVLYVLFAAHPEVGTGPESAHVLAGAGSRVWSAVFHSVSAFCNAGFSLSHGNLAGFVRSPGVTVTIALLITAGGLGFPVLDELWLRWRERRRGPSRRLSLHARVVLTMSAVLVAGGTVAFLALEWSASLADLSFGEKVLAAAFHSVSTRTAGFNTVDFGRMGAPILLVACFLMFVGASPGSTGGGIKTTSLAVMLAAFRAEMRGASSPRVFDRSIPDTVARKAVAVAVGGVVVVAAGWFALLVVEHDPKPLHAFFEVVSAFATCGLSTGTTLASGQSASLSGAWTAAGKLVITLVMFIGRIGPVTLALAVVARPRTERFSVPEERVLIG